MRAVRHTRHARQGRRSWHRNGTSEVDPPYLLHAACHELNIGKSLILFITAAIDSQPGL